MIKPINCADERKIGPDEPIKFKHFSVSRLISSLQYAARGIVFLLRSEQNARIHAIITVSVGILAYILEVTRLEAAVLFIAIILVFAIEIINTAIEKIFDVCHPEDHNLIRGVKDAMAGAVMISAIIAVVVGFLVFLPHIEKLIL